MHISEIEIGANTSFDVSDSFGREGLEWNQTSGESGPIDATRAISMTRYHIGEEINGRLPDEAQRPCRSVEFRLGDRKSSVKGKSVSVRVDLGGRRSIK